MIRLILLALASDLLTPTLIWKGWLPAEARWLSSAALALILIIAYARVIRSKHVPVVLWLVVAFTLIGSATALLGGQDIASTAWGWWLMFRYPLVGLGVYLQSNWSANFVDGFLRLCYILVPLEVAVQIVQYLTGQTPGDSLAGTLGPQGTGLLVMLVIWVLALTLGDWIARRRVYPVIFVVLLGMVASALGEMKVFPIMAGVIGLIAAVMYGLRNHRLQQVLTFTPVLIGAAALFPQLYNEIVPEARVEPFFAYFDPDTLDRYLGSVSVSGDHYDVGRNYGLVYSWQQISSDNWTLLLGDGLGARGESKTLGTAGAAIRSGDLGLYTGSSLAVIMGELGLAGLLALAGFVLWTSVKLWLSTRTDEPSGLLALRYGVLIYTLTWPVWVWYNSSWQEPVPALLYWVALGYVMRPKEEGEMPAGTNARALAPGANWGLQRG